MRQRALFKTCFVNYEDMIDKECLFIFLFTFLANEENDIYIYVYIY